MKNKIITFFAIIIILVGTVIFLYPVITSYITKNNQINVIDSYEEIIESEENSIDYDEEIKKAREYNENLSGEPVHDPFVSGTGYTIPKNYNNILALTDVMGYIKIPKISASLPIYHGTSDEVMEKGIGHIASTSFPIGGSSTHVVLTGHRGLPNAELFTRIDELVEGDKFYITVLNQTIAYKVCKIEVVLPTDLDSIQIESGKDLVTLVTCTPYGINSHRLLVTGERTDYTEGEEDIKLEYSNIATAISKSGIFSSLKYYIYVIIIFILIILVILLIRFIYKAYKNHQYKKRHKRKGHL